MKYYIITNDEECGDCHTTISLCKRINSIDKYKENNELNTCINCGVTLFVSFGEDLNIVKTSKKQYELFYALFSKKR